MQELTALLEAELDVPSSDERAHRNAGRRLHHAGAKRLADRPTLEQPLQRDATRACGIAYRPCRQHSVTQCTLAVDRRSARACLHSDCNVGVQEIGLAVSQEATRRNELVDRIGGEHHDVERLAVLDSPGSFDTTDRFERYFAARAG